MRPLREVIGDYTKNTQALAHFNVSDSDQLEGIARGAHATGLPVIVGLSEGERSFFPLTHARALVEEYRNEGCLIYLNADHTYSFEHVERALQSGVDAVVVDGATLSFDENIALTKKAVSLRGSQNVLIEGELGYIGQSSSVMDNLPEGVALTPEMMTKPDELVRFVEETGIDLVAPAVGNIHGIVTSGQPKLNIKRITELSSASSVPLVLHGGSGSSDEEFTEAIAAGISIIHINTDLRVLYTKDLAQSLTDHPREVAPYKVLEPVVADTARYVSQKMRLFAGR